MTQKTSIFQDIAALLPELEELERHPGGPRSPRSGRATPDTSRLPFGIIIDDPDKPADALTVAGIQAWATQRARTISSGAQPLTALDMLHVVIWQEGGQGHPDGDLILEEAQHIYARIARRTGHGHIRYGWCSCGGAVWQKATDEGLTDWMVCDGPAEHFFKDAADYAAAQRSMARSVTHEGRYWVSARQAHAIWPGLDRRTLHSWVTRGHVTVSAGKYDLAQINTRMSSLAKRQAA